MKRISGLLMAVLMSGILMASETTTAGVRVGIRIGPPAPRREVVVVRTRPNAAWVAGHWYWHPRHAQYVWIDGRWIDGRPDYVWVDGHWKHTPFGWMYVEGHWRKI
jgi:hypothetical protein